MDSKHREYFGIRYFELPNPLPGTHLLKMKGSQLPMMFRTVEVSWLSDFLASVAT